MDLYCFLLLVFSTSFLSPPPALASGDDGTRRRPRELLQSTVPFVETYWESYDSWPYNYSSCYTQTPADVDESAYGYDLRELPVGSLSQPGANVINIAFASQDYSDCYYNSGCNPFICGLHLFLLNGMDSERIQDLRDDISLLQAQGAVVKLAFGGEEWGNPGALSHIPNSYSQTVDDIARAVRELDADGVDLAMEEGCGTANFVCSDQTSTHLYLLQKLREELPDKIISYTFPSSAPINYPFNDVVMYGERYVDYFNLYRATDEHVQEALDFGLAPEKLVRGVAIGCNPSVGYDTDEEVTVEEAESVAASVRDGGFAGVATWSINRDTDHRPGEDSGCTWRQTGEEDGTYISAIYNALNG